MKDDPSSRYDRQNACNNYRRIFRWCLSDSKSAQITRTLLSILADFINAVVWMVSVLVLISNFSSLFFLPWDVRTPPNYKWYYHHCHVPLYFLKFSSRSILSLCFIFTLWSTGTIKSTIIIIIIIIIVVVVVLIK